MTRFLPSCLARRFGGFSVCVFTATMGFSIAQDNPEKKAVPQPATPALKATPVAAGKAMPVIKAMPIEIGDAKETADGNKPPPIEDQLSFANLLFSHQQYAIAIRQYELFLKDFPESPNAASAAYRLGECYLQLKQHVQAKQAYDQMIKRFKTGVYTGAAAFRLATLYFNEKNFAKAIPWFDLAKANISNPGIELQSSYYRAHCLEATDQKKEALAAYEQLLATQGQGPENPFAEPSRMAVSRLYTDLGDNAAALISFKNVIAHSKDPAHLDEANARGGLIAAKLGKREESNQMLDKVLKSESGKTWKALAQIGLIFNYFSDGDYDAVIQTYNRGIYDAPADSKAQMLLLVAHAHRLTKQLKPAEEVYGILERNYRDRPEGIEGGYRRLQCLHLLNDGGLPVYAGRYIEQQQKVDPKSKFLDLAQLMKAEWHFEHNEFAEAAKAYAEVRPENIPPEHHIVRLYKLGWSQGEGGEPDKGIATLSEFLKKYPQDHLAPSALAKRANAYQTAKDLAKALADYQTLASQYSGSSELEFALQQIAVIQLELKDTPAMIAAFLNLLEKFPKTGAAAEANFWIGSGYVQQKQYQQAIAYLDKARKLDGKTYYEVATRRIILASYQLENIESLADETEAFLAEKRKLTIPEPVFTYLGIKLFENGQLARAARFLELSSTPDAPGQTRPEVWDYLGRANLELKRYDKAIAPLEFYLEFIQRPSLRAKTYVNKGHARLGLKEYDKATDDANEALRLQKEGRINATARMLLGDIAFAKGDHESAARLYSIVSQLFIDPLITPLALHKASLAYGKSGQTEKARQLQDDLKAKYPGFEEPKD